MRLCDICEGSQCKETRWHNSAKASFWSFLGVLTASPPLRVSFAYLFTFDALKALKNVKFKHCFVNLGNYIKFFGDVEYDCDTILFSFSPQQGRIDAVTF